MKRHASCCVPLCTNNFRNSPGLEFCGIPKARRIQRECVRLLRGANLKLNSDSKQICILLVCKIAPGTSSFSFSFTFSFFFSFNVTFRFAISLSCFNPAITFHFAFRHVCLHSRSPKQSHKCARA